MKFSEQWLREWANPPLTSEQLAEQLTMVGLEVSGIEPAAAIFSGVVVGEVLAVEPHPNADKLQICQVNAGEDTPLNVVCGARNVYAGMRAPFARIGACFPKLTIRQTKLRGVESFGMLCSEAELGLAESSAGLMSLPADAPVGEDLRSYLQLDDVNIELDLTPNRGDCLGIMGIAREAGALADCAVHNPEAPSPKSENISAPPVFKPIAAVIPDVFPLEVANSAACPRYAGRVIKEINVRAPTPMWMLERLRRSGLRGISAVVDITNYVMLELGQPMHAFDLAKLSGGIVVRSARAHENIQLLDGQNIQLDTDTLVIADHSQPQALAGIMGGAAAAVSETARDIFLESAFFTSATLAGCARRYGLHTDSSHRFERGVDPALQRHAIERASALLIEITGGRPGPVIEFSDAAKLPVPPEIKLRAARVQRVLGQAIPPAEIENYLTRLGMQLTPLEGDTWRVKPPSFRFDIGLEADLIEEIARSYGYNRLSGQKSAVRLAIQPRTDQRLQTVQSVLVQRGYQEAITYSFVDPKLQTLLDESPSPFAEKPISLANPLASDLSVMRTHIWPSLLQTMRHNCNRQQSDVRLFESGLLFYKDKDGLIHQENALAGVATGMAYPEQWGETARPLDFFDIKGDVEAVLKLSGQDVCFVNINCEALHPGQSAAIMRNGERIGLIGALHPEMAAKLDLPDTVYLFELGSLQKKTLPRFQAFSKFPSIRRDIAIIISKHIPAAELTDYIRKNGTELLTDLRIFDVYQGEGIDPDKKSLALGLTFRASSRNLKEEEVDSIIAQVLDALAHEFQASLR
ncbi:MAG: phenylalanine--tRNA ligase subunit beta [Gammaproteobacteria bacterium]|nr:phenylalanine--tRNA ligase subunit beta [Gammaproteobacteria bacterium]